MTESVSARYSYPPPEFDGAEESYAEWLPMIAMWLKMTSIPASKQAMTIALSMKGRAKSIAAALGAGLLESADQVSGLEAGLGPHDFPTGVVTLISALNDAGYRASAHMMSFQALQEFIEIQGRQFKSMKEYTSAFTTRFRRASQECGLKLDEPCAAMMMLLKSDLSKDEFARVMSQAGSANSLTQSKMKDALHWLYPTTIPTTTADSRNLLQHSVESALVTSTDDEIVDVLEAGYDDDGEQVFVSRRMIFQKRGRGGENQHQAGSRIDLQHIQCYACRRFGHFQRNCPKKPHAQSKGFLAYFQSQALSQDSESLSMDDIQQTSYHSSSVTHEIFWNHKEPPHAILDSGCTATVMGSVFLSDLKQRYSLSRPFENVQAQLSFNSVNNVNGALQ